MGTEYDGMSKEELVKKLKEQPSNNTGMNISNCSFKGVSWDKDASEAVLVVAKGLLNLTELFKSQNITIESLISHSNND